MRVDISISGPGEWDTYGVAGFGSHRYFILNGNGISQPQGFPYKSGSATGFGGVLLIEGMDPFSAITAVPLAYDLACPVERQADIRVTVDTETYVAVCKECNSTFDVTMRMGAAISGIAAQYKYNLKAYNCIPSGSGGYNIYN